MDPFMEDIYRRVEKLKETAREREKNQPKPEYSCEICQDREMIISEDGRSASDCECIEAKRIKRRMKKSGLTEIFEGKTFQSFFLSDRPKEIHIARGKAKAYVAGFDQKKKGVDGSIAFLGPSGSGKTHLTIAIANDLLKKNIAVDYFSYREGMTKLKQSIIDRERYQQTIDIYKKVRVLLIDDLFKGRYTDSDINIMFEIINHRYLHKRPMIISSEHSSKKLIEIDEAIGSRIVEMSGNYLIELKEKEKNYRLLKKRA